MKPFSIFVALITALAAPAATAPANNNASLTSEVTLFNSTLVPRGANDDPKKGGDDPEDDPDDPFASWPIVWCEVHQPEMMNHYKTIIRKVPQSDVGHLCHLLWKGIMRHWALCLPSATHCGYMEVKPGEPALEWKFTTMASCNGGCIASAYWVATKNKYGPMDQTRCN